jgi:hypothetical protein
MIERDILPLSRITGEEQQRKRDSWVEDGLLDYALHNVGGEA